MVYISHTMQKLKKLAWIEELLPNVVAPKNMLGGVGYYLDEKWILTLVEFSKTTEHKGRSYPFELWNGCLFPVEEIKQTKVWSLFQFLENHPVKKNCLYLPADSQDFEEEVKAVLREIVKGNPLFGIWKKGESKAAQKNRFSQEANEMEELLEEPLDVSRPRLFDTEGPSKKSNSQKTKANRKKASQKKLPSKTKKIPDAKSKSPIRNSSPSKANKKNENAFLLSMLNKNKKNNPT